MSFEPGSLIVDRYRIVRQLGHGGMGVVFLAEDTRLDNLQVALKVQFEPAARLSPTAMGAGVAAGNDGALFEQEASALARLKHAGLPRVTDHFATEHRERCLVMEYVEGRDLDTALREDGPIPEERVYGYADQLCDILAYLHMQVPPVVHRDVKPGNIRLTPEGRVVLVDFGIAKAGIAGVTVTGARAVSSGFSPPEQYGGAMRTDARSDVYALGATLYSLLTGMDPPTATDRAAGQSFMASTIEGAPIGPAMHAVLERAMALPQEARYASANEMKLALVQARSGDVSAGSFAVESINATRPMAAPPTPRLETPRKKSHRVATAAALVVLAAVVGVLLVKGAGKKETAIAEDQTVAAEGAGTPQTSGLEAQRAEQEQAEKRERQAEARKLREEKRLAEEQEASTQREQEEEVSRQAEQKRREERESALQLVSQAREALSQSNIESADDLLKEAEQLDSSAPGLASARGAVNRAKQERDNAKARERAAVAAREREAREQAQREEAAAAASRPRGSINRIASTPMMYDGSHGIMFYADIDANNVQGHNLEFMIAFFPAGSSNGTIVGRKYELATYEATTWTNTGIWVSFLNVPGGFRGAMNSTFILKVLDGGNVLVQSREFPVPTR